MLVEHNYLTDGKEQKKLFEVAVGFGNAKGSPYPLPQGMQLTARARIVIFPINSKEAK